MAPRYGTLRGLDACASPRGTFTVLALDHRGNLRRILRPDDPDAVSHDQMVDLKRAVVRALGDVADGVLLDPAIGVAGTIADGTLPARTGLIVALEATGYQGPATARISRLLPGWSVAQAKRMGADAVKLLLYYHPDAANADDQERLLIEVAEACADADIALFLEPLSYAVDEASPRLTGEDRRSAVVRTARRLTALGGDVLKAEFPYDPSVTDPARWEEACAELDQASATPWVLLSGGVDDATFEAQTEAACAAGASGVLAGRSVWAPSATLPAEERAAWLASEGRARLERLAAVVERLGRPWRERSDLAREPAPAEDWYLDYPA
jgi:tagatose 1,6-diphosphate aldolase